MEPTYSGSVKRAKAPLNATQVAHCLVDGCNADLSLCRDYHRRHKVCEIHSKTPKVTIGGREQRFCQQCSRFHSLVEFDEGKRSCRKRLDGHNRRRRKPQPESLAPIPGLSFSGHQNVGGTRFLSFTSQQVLPTAVVDSTWSDIVKTENEVLLYNNQPQLKPSMFSAQSYNKGVNQVEFMQPSERAMCLNPNASNSSHRALSLLSSESPASPQVQPLLHNLGYSGLGEYQFLEESSNSNQVVVSGLDGSNSPTLEMFQQGSSTGGSHQTLTFRWE